MEDPEREVPLVLKKLLRRPTFESMADTIRQYFTEDIAFYHLYANVAPTVGISVYTLLFQFMVFFINYQEPLVHDMVYDEKKNMMAVRMTVRTNPWIFLWRTVNLQFLIEFEFRDVIDENTGKVLKKIKVQRDYFIRSPIVQLIPIIGNIYDSERLRYIVGESTAATIRFIVRTYDLLVPAKLREDVFEFWREYLQVPPNEQHSLSTD
ncbi:hypothetical protein R1sor_008475 [Riccia sorocarpa]|uniref:SigF-like NTF2-like domain-containing protein n=1 Tax=Riccia sorocarpa TaxID=122646 RepID=A0ABD3HVP2_9MARC